MKVVIATPYYHPHVGGVEVYVRNIATRLKEMGWEVCLVTTGDRSAKTTVTQQDGMRVYRLGYQFKLSNTPVSFTWRRDIERIITSEKPDVINGHAPVPYFADMVERLRGRIPFVLTYHNDVVKERWPFTMLAKLAHLFLIAGTLRRANRIIATSDYYASRSRHLAPHTHKLSVVPPGIDAAIFTTDADGATVRKAHDGKRIILFVGSLSRAQAHKGLDTLIASMAIVKQRIPNAQLVVVGEGDNLAHYQQTVYSAGLQDDVAFVGCKTHAELAGYYAASDVVVLPSTNNTEGFGMVLIEASACGVPVVGTEVGGIPFAIQDGKTGLLVPPRNPEALAASIGTILEDASLAARLGRAGAARAKTQFDWDMLTASTSHALTQAIQPTIAHVAGYYPPHLGGMEKVAQALAERMAASGYDTRVLTSNIPSTPPPAHTPNLLVRRFGAFEFAHTPIAFGFIPAIFRLPRQSVIHLHLAQAFYPELVWLASKIRGIPYIVHFHLDLMPSGALGKLFLAYKAIVITRVIRSAARVAVFSAEQQQFIERTYHVPAERIVVIPNGVDDVFFGKPKSYAGKKKFAIVYAGRLSPQKRVDRLVGAMAELGDRATLTIVGDGERKASLEQQVAKMGLTNVTFTGYKSPVEIREYFAAADVFVIPSEREGMPLVVLEAMAAGLPIVGSNVTGIRELVRGVGALVNDPSPAMFAEALNGLFAVPEELTRMSRKSIQTARTYTWSRVSDDFKKVYTEVAK
ncbi:MAG TPA: glycosyltransferase [Candidatus Saccharimonadales bacterium]|nr:glycosyltransferase [Candidatus Saccharimonadales bacterium]